MNLHDYFWSYLLEAYLCGWLTDEDVDEALEDPKRAYRILEDCLEESLSRTCSIAQGSLWQLKKFINQRKQNID